MSRIFLQTAGRGLHTPPQIEQAIEIIILLISIQRDGPDGAFL